MSDPVASLGLHFDEVNKLRIIDPEISKQTLDLKEECNDFLISKILHLFNHVCIITFLYDVIMS